MVFRERFIGNVLSTQEIVESNEHTHVQLSRFYVKFTIGESLDLWSLLLFLFIYWKTSGRGCLAEEEEKTGNVETYLTTRKTQIH